MARSPVPAHGFSRRRARIRSGVGVHRLRSDRAEPSHRHVARDHAARASPGVWAQARRSRGRRHGPHRRSVGQGIGASARRRGDDRHEHGGHRQAARAFSRFHGRERRATARQRRVARVAQGGGVHARRGQALHRELHVAEGFGAGPYGGRDLIHRILVHAPPGVRLSRAAPPPRRAHPDGRQRSVGEHHGGHRADSPEHGTGRARGHLAARHDRGRNQIREDGSRRRGS